jgi:uncharacterized protein
MTTDGARGLPYSGKYHCPAGFFEPFGKMNQAAELTPGEAVQYLPADDTGCHTGPAEIHLASFRRERYRSRPNSDVYYKDPSAVTALLEV